MLRIKATINKVIHMITVIGTDNNIGYDRTSMFYLTRRYTNPKDFYNLTNTVLFFYNHSHLDSLRQIIKNELHSGDSLDS